MPPGLDVAVVPDPMVVTTGRVGERLGAIRARVRLLASMDVLVRFEVEFGSKALTTLAADNGTNLQVNSPNVPLHQARTRLETTLIPTCISPDTLGFTPGQSFDVIVGVSSRWGAGSGRRLDRKSVV